jgi:ABC-type dipeptide/oligopeptide/nickel transport system ATPase subunit
MKKRNTGRKEQHRHGVGLLERVGIDAGLQRTRANKMIGGEKQRVAGEAEALAEAEPAAAGRW